MYVNWTKYSCPNCGNLLGRRIVSSAVDLGNPTRFCRKCNAPYRSLQREWIDLSGREKVEYFLSLWSHAFLCGCISFFRLMLRLGEAGLEDMRNSPVLRMADPNYSECKVNPKSVWLCLRRRRCGGRVGRANAGGLLRLVLGLGRRSGSLLCRGSP